MLSFGPIGINVLAAELEYVVVINVVIVARVALPLSSSAPFGYNMAQTIQDPSGTKDPVHVKAAGIFTESGSIGGYMPRQTEPGDVREALDLVEAFDVGAVVDDFRSPAEAVGVATCSAGGVDGIGDNPRGA